MSWDLPEVDNDGNVWTSWTHYNARSLLYWYRQWHKRDLELDNTDSYEITINLAGRLDDPEPIPARKGEERWSEDRITDGEIQLITDWLATHFTGDVEEDVRDDSCWRINCLNWGRFVPSGGQTPRSLTTNI